MMCFMNVLSKQSGKYVGGCGWEQFSTLENWQDDIIYL